MKNVAALAGVGTKTVSRVINGEPNVSVATADRVWNAVRALDYHVDLQAGSLRRADGRTRTLGLLVGSVDNPFAAAIHRAVEDGASARGVAVFASSLDDDPLREEAAVNAFMRRRVDGLILTTSGRSTGYLGSVREVGIPVVYIDREPVESGIDSITSDNRAGAAAATEHLIAHGHRRIALLTDRLEIQTAYERRQGFLDALGRAGIPTTSTPMITELHDEASAQAALTRLLHSDEPPTAIFSAQNLDHDRARSMLCAQSSGSDRSRSSASTIFRSQIWWIPVSPSWRSIHTKSAGSPSSDCSRDSRATRVPRAIRSFRRP